MKLQDILASTAATISLLVVYTFYTPPGYSVYSGISRNASYERKPSNPVNFLDSPLEWLRPEITRPGTMLFNDGNQTYLVDVYCSETAMKRTFSRSPDSAITFYAKQIGPNHLSMKKCPVR